VKIEGGALPHTPRFFALVSREAVLSITKKSGADIHRLPYKPTRALGSLLSVALSSLVVKHG